MNHVVCVPHDGSTDGPGSSAGQQALLHSDNTFHEVLICSCDQCLLTRLGRRGCDIHLHQLKDSHERR